VIEEQPSQTAMTAAAARAAHLIVDGSPTIFADTLAETLLGKQADEFIDYHRNHGDHPILRGARQQAVIRSRFTEDRLTARIAEGVTQYVLLGAGLDSFAYRSTSGVRVFEVDHPATQAWKRRTLADAGITLPDQLTMVPVDFETDSLADRLADSGFDPASPAVVSWLGVIGYLTIDAIDHTLDVVGGFAPGTDIMIDYILPHGMRDANGDLYVEQVSRVAAQRGEPWLTFLSPDDMTVLLAKHGFGSIEHFMQRDFPYWTGRSDGLSPNALSVMVRATVTT
jgi:methyltransferase (TIGR00027 family)